jgi:hypothetical protein
LASFFDLVGRQYTGVNVRANVDVDKLSSHHTPFAMLRNTRKTRIQKIKNDQPQSILLSQYLTYI